MYIAHKTKAVVLVLVVSLPLMGPTDSAHIRWKVPAPSFAPAPMTGNKATKRTTIPIPPSQFVIDRQNNTAFVQPSIFVNVVAPVVVKPLILQSKHWNSL